MIVTGPAVVEWVAHRIREYGFGGAQGIGVSIDGEIVGGVVYSDFNGANICMHVASDGTKRWMQKRALWMWFDYPFNQCGVKRVSAFVGEKNTESRRLCERVGFKLEARLKGAHPTGDMLIYRMFKNDCKWIQHEKLSLAA